MDRLCGECRFFKVREPREDGAVGVCRLGKVMGVFRDSMRACPSFSRQGEAVVVADAPRRRGTRPRTSMVGAPVAKAPVSSPSALHAFVAEAEPEALKEMLVALLVRTLHLDEIGLGRAWSEGRLILTPANPDLKSKELELEQYFHKLVMIREQLRVLEQKVNSARNLHGAERIDFHRRLVLVHSALLSMAGDWQPDRAGPAILDRLKLEVEGARLALPRPPIGPRWRGGRVVFAAGELQAEESVERFFHRLVVLRDRLRALEAELEAHPHVTGDEASVMASYVRRCYGTLTSFNLLFADRADYFSSSR